MHKLFGVMKNNGSKFVFDSPHNEPSDKPVTKEYEIDGKKYVEICWKIGDEIQKVQIVEDMPPHCTKMNWISSDKFMKTCKTAIFKTTFIRDGNRDIYVCVK